MANTFREFIARNSVQPAKPLPLVHTTAAYHLGSILDSQSLRPQVCDVFASDLTYFFVGRPAYKVRLSDGEAELWELPCCFIFEYETVPRPTRVFPFDSGAFAKGLMPSYLSLMPRDSFDVSSIDSAATKIIGAFFGDGRAYLAGRPKASEAFKSEFAIDIFDPEVEAVHRLAIDRHSEHVDDRRLTVEIQTGEVVDLVVRRPIAVVAPAPYFDNAGFRQQVVEIWKAKPIAYSVSSLSTGAYYSAIYERIQGLYEELDLL